MSTPSFSELLFHSRRLDFVPNKYKEIELLRKEFHCIKPKYKIIKRDNRKYVSLHPRHKILDSFLFSKLQEQYHLSNNNYSMKGVHAAIKKAYPLFLKTNYHLKTDIKDYFPSINKKHILEIVQSFNYKKQLSAILDTENGLPLGLIVSGYLANFFLKNLDNYYKNYFRYVDDILLFSDNMFKLHNIKSGIEKHLQKYNLKLNKEKTRIAENKKLDYLGYVMTPTHLYPRENIMRSFFSRIKNQDLMTYKPWFCFPEQY